MDYRSVSLKLTERVVAKGGEKGKRAYRRNRKPRCRFKLSPITCHQPFLNKERVTFLGDFSSANLQSKRWGGEVVCLERTVFLFLLHLLFSSFSLRIQAQGSRVD